LSSIAIVTPSYNQGKYISRTIESVLSQGVSNLDYMIVDGGSRDETTQVLKTFGDRVRWISEPDKGMADAVNKGFLATQGDIVGWLNSDDIYYPETLQTVLEFFNAHPEIDVVYGGAHHIDANGRLLEVYPTEPFSWNRLIDTCIISQPASFFRRRTIERFGPLDAALPTSEDYELWIRWAKNGAKFQYLDKFLAATRLHAEARTIAERVACHKANNDILKHHLGSVPIRWLFAYAYAVVEERNPTRARGLAFTSAMTLEFVKASLRWNHRVPLGLFQMIGSYIARNFRDRPSTKRNR
jgi:glycosyltransferase involved in cell wall biosynthesis